MYLEADILETFRNDGVVVIRSFFYENTISEMTAALLAYERETMPRLPSKFYTREVGTEELRCLFWMNIFSPYFAKQLQDRHLLDCIEFLTGWQPKPMFVEAFMKPAKCGGRIPLHQDVAYSAVSPHQQATIWVPIDPVREGNGAVRYLAGSHKEGLRLHRTSGTLGSSLEVADTKKFQEVFYELNPGDVLVHDGLVMHYSRGNRSAAARRAIAFGFRGESTGFFKLII